MTKYQSTNQAPCPTKAQYLSQKKLWDLKINLRFHTGSLSGLPYSLCDIQNY